MKRIEEKRFISSYQCKFKKEDIILNEEMDKNIVEYLEQRQDAVACYAAARIVELEKQMNTKRTK